jgi:hypothetical protein
MCEVSAGSTREMSAEKWELQEKSITAISRKNGAESGETTKTGAFV